MWLRQMFRRIAKRAYQIQHALLTCKPTEKKHNESILRDGKLSAYADSRTSIRFESRGIDSAN